jgi:hypothetical protein
MARLPAFLLEIQIFLGTAPGEWSAFEDIKLFLEFSSA